MAGFIASFVWDLVFKARTSKVGLDLKGVFKFFEMNLLIIF